MYGNEDFKTKQFYGKRLSIALQHTDDVAASYAKRKNH
jgi:hypothetical protein